MSAGDTQPTLPIGEWAPAPEKRRSPWPWIIAFAIVAVLAVGAWFLGEAIARNIVVTTIRTQITSNLALPADQEIDVEVEGAVIPQLIAGTLDDVRIASQDVALGPFDGDVSVHATGVPIRGGELGSAEGEVRLDETQLRHLMSSVEGFPSDALGISAPDVTASTQFEVLGATFPIGISLTPSASEGQLVLTPASIQVAGADVTADELRRQFGILSNAVLRDWPVCIAEYLPAGLVLTNVVADGDELVGNFTVSSTILTDPGMLEPGSC